jgi:hypothetical protein
LRADAGNRQLSVHPIGDATLDVPQKLFQRATDQ